jgi:hypothetical protein
MTYNFDPDRWYAIEWDFIEACARRNAWSAEKREAALQKLEARYAEMWSRLDGGYRIPRQ